MRRGRFRSIAIPSAALLRESAHAESFDQARERQSCSNARVISLAARLLTALTIASATNEPTSSKIPISDWLNEKYPPFLLWTSSLVRVAHFHSGVRE